MAAPAETLAVTRTPRVVLVLSFLVLMLEGYDIIMYGTVVPGLLRYQQWGVTPGQAGNIGSYTVAGMLVGALVAGMVSDRVGRRRVLLASVALFSVAMALCAVAGSPEQLTLFRILVGIGTGGLMPTVVALMVEYSPVKQRGISTAIGFAGVGIGGAAAGLLGTALVPDHGFRIMFALGAIPAVLIVPVLWRLLPESAAYLLATGRRAEAARLAERLGCSLVGESGAEGPAEESTGWLGATRTLLAPPYLWPTVVFSGAIFFCLLVLFGANTWLPSLMIKSGYGVTSSLSFLLVLNLGAAAGTLLASLVADRVGSKPVVIAAFLAAAISLSLLALRPPVAVVYVLVAVAGVGTTGTQILLNTYIGSYFPTHLRATALGIALGVGRVGGIVGPTYGGHLLGRLGHGWQFQAYAIPAVVGAAVVLTVPRLRRGAAAKTGVARVRGHEQQVDRALDTGV